MAYVLAVGVVILLACFSGMVWVFFKSRRLKRVLRYLSSDPETRAFMRLIDEMTGQVKAGEISPEDAKKRIFAAEKEAYKKIKEFLQPKKRPIKK